MGEPRWNPTATIHAVQFEWEDEPTPRPVRLTTTAPIPGEPVRIELFGAEVEGVIVQLSSAVLHVRLPKLKMQSAAARKSLRRQAR